MKRGRPKTRTNRQIVIQKIIGKVARNVYAVIEYDMYKNNIAKLYPSEAKDLLKACSMAINELKR
jgi:hypothetical protein